MDGFCHRAFPNRMCPKIPWDGAQMREKKKCVFPHPRKGNSALNDSVGSQGYLWVGPGLLSKGMEKLVMM